MPRKVISFSRELSAGYKGYIDAYNIVEGDAVLGEIEAYSDVTDPNIVLLAVYYGNLKVYPDEGLVSITQRAFRDKIGFKYPNYTTVKLYVENRDTANPHKIWGTIELEVM